MLVFLYISFKWAIPDIKVAFTPGQNTPRKMVVFLLKKTFFYLSNSQVYGVLRAIISFALLLFCCLFITIDSKY